MSNILSNQETLVLSLQDALDKLLVEGRIEEATVWSKMLLEALQGLGAISGKTLSPVNAKATTAISSSPYRTQAQAIKPQESSEYALGMDAAYVKRARELAEMDRVQRQPIQPTQPVVSSYSYNDGMRDPKNLKKNLGVIRVLPDDGDYTPASTYTYNRNTQQQIKPQHNQQELSELDVWEDDPRRAALNTTIPNIDERQRQ